MAPGQLTKSVAFGLLVLSVGVLQTRQVLREWNNKPSSGQESLLPAGTPSPTLEAPGTNSRLMNLNDFKGQLVLVSFWASWCGPCRTEMPELRDFVSQWNRHSSRTHDLVWLAVNFKDDLFTIKKTISDERYKETRFLLDPKGLNAERWKVEAFPTLYLIDPDGRIISGSRGYSPALRSWLWMKLDPYTKPPQKAH